MDLHWSLCQCGIHRSIGTPTNIMVDWPSDKYACLLNLTLLNYKMCYMDLYARQQKTNEHVPVEQCDTSCLPPC